MVRRTLWVVALTACLDAQSVIATHAGLVSYAEQASLDGRAVEISIGRPLVMNNQSVLRTAAGRAEVLLGPCAAMWMDRNSSVRMIDNDLRGTRVELLIGSALVAAGGLPHGSQVTFLLKGAAALIEHRGAYRFNAAPPALHVVSGKTAVQWADQNVTLTAGLWMPLEPPVYVRKSGKHARDPLEVWGRQRAAILAKASGPRVVLLENDPPVRPQLEDTRTVPNNPQPGPAPVQIPVPPGCGVTAW